MKHNLILAAAAVFFLVFSSQGTAQTWQEETVQKSRQLLEETMAKSIANVPQSMIENASGVALIPNVVKGGFVVGASFGRGVLMIKEPNGTWHAPVFITLTGGNVGWQAGVQSSDVILVFKTPKSIQGVLSGKLTLGADAAAAGPIGRQSGIATDGQLQAEIYTYSRSRGLFLGVAIDGSVLQVDRLATGSYYQITGINQTPNIPPSARALTEAVASYAQAIAGGGGAPGTAYAQQLSTSEAELVRAQVVQIAPRLFDMLDETWKNYLGLPAWMFVGGAPPDPAAVQEIVSRYDSVARDPRYAALASRPEFQSVYGLLKHYAQSMETAGAALQLPPPPR